MDFNQPSSGGGFFITRDHLGCLILVTKVHEVYHNSMNVYQGKPAPRDEAKVDVVNLDRDGVLMERVTMTHPGLVNRLTTGATNVLGRIGQHTSPNGEYFALDEYQPQDVERATAWVQQWQAGQMRQPQAQPQGGQNAPQGAPQPQGNPQGAQGSWGGQSGPGAPQSQGYGQQAQPGYGGQGGFGGQGGQPQPPAGGQYGPPQGQQQGDPWGGAPSYNEPPF